MITLYNPDTLIMALKDSKTWKQGTGPEYTAWGLDDYGVWTNVVLNIGTNVVVATSLYTAGILVFKNKDLPL
jgi:hypothetical protein